jgi:hypothetical protein
MLFRVVRDRRIWPLLICSAVVALGLLLVEYVHIHYLAPITGAFIILVIQSLRHVATFRPRGQPVGRFATFCILGGSFIFTASDAWARRGWHRWGWPIQREQIQEGLIRRGGKHVIIVRYSPSHNPVCEWVYNAADIDASPVVWAREMAENSALLKYFAGRRIWLLEADVTPPKIQLYPVRQMAEELVPVRRNQ